jgi:hypothetical protein
VITATGGRFGDFAPYVPSVNEDGAVAFQAALHAGGSGVFVGHGEEVAEVVGPGELAEVTSHPDLSNAGATSFYAVRDDESQGVFLVRDGVLQTIATTTAGFAAVGPLGPTMNEAGLVAFRADRERERSGIFTGDGDTVATVAETGDRWAGFQGLPVVNNAGTVVFRADLQNGGQGIYAARGGSIETIAESGETFESLGHFPSLNDAGTVAFAATVHGGIAGTFTAENGRVAQVVGADGAFESSRGALVIGAGAVVSIATPKRGTLGLFAGPDPSADRILGLGDRLFGSVVEDFAANPVSVSAGGYLAVRVRLTDGRQLVLRAEPAA